MQNFVETNLDHNLLPTIAWPPRIINSTATLIDNIYILNGLQNGFELCIMLSEISDHLLILKLVKKTKHQHNEALEFKTQNLNNKRINEIQNLL